MSLGGTSRANRGMPRLQIVSAQVLTIGLVVLVTFPTLPIQAHSLPLAGPLSGLGPASPPGGSERSTASEIASNSFAAGTYQASVPEKNFGNGEPNQSGGPIDGVAYSWVPFNRTLVKGAFAPYEDYSPDGLAAYDGRVFVGGYQILALNGSTGVGLRGIHQPVMQAGPDANPTPIGGLGPSRCCRGLASSARPAGFIVNASTFVAGVDPVTHDLIVSDASAGRYDFFNESTLVLDGSVPVDAPGFATYVRSTGLIYAITDGNITVLNATTWKNVSSWPFKWGLANIAPAFDLVNRDLYVANWNCWCIDVLNISSGRPARANLSTFGSYVVDNLTGELLVASDFNGTLTVYNASTFKTWNLSINGYSAGTLAFDWRDNELFSLSGGVYGIALSNRTVVGQWPAGDYTNSIVYDGHDDLVYVCNYWSDNLSAINPTTSQIQLPNIPLGATYGPVAYDPLRQQIDVAGVQAFGNWNAQNDFLTTLSANGPRPAFAGTTVMSGNSPSGIAVDGATGDVYVSDQYADNIAVINASSDHVINSVSLGSPFWGSSFAGPTAVAYDSSSGDLYVADSATDNLTVFNGSNRSVAIPHLRVGWNPEGIAVDSTTDRVFVSNLGSNNVTVIDGRTKVSVGPGIPVRSPGAIAFDSANGLVYVANYHGHNVTIINASTDAVVGNATVGGAPYDISVDSARNTIYVFDLGPGDVRSISGATNRVVGAPISVSASSDGMAFDPVTGELYLGNYGNGTIEVLSPGVLQAAQLDIRPNPTEVGRSVIIAANASGGRSPYSFQYAGLPRGCASANSSILLCPMEVPGLFSINVTVLSADGYVATASTYLLVNSPLSVNASISGPSHLEVGESTYIEANSGGGVPPISFRFTGLPGGCESSNTSYLACQPNASGDYLVDVIASDAVGARVDSVVLLVVIPPPEIQVSWWIPNPVRVGENATLVVEVNGGVSPYGYAYYGLPPGCRDTGTPTLLCRPEAAGDYSVVVWVTDSMGGRVNLTRSLEVLPPIPEPPPVILAFFADPDPLTLGGSTTFTVVIENSTPTDEITFTGLPAGCPSISSSTLTCRPTETGVFDVRVAVGGPSGPTATANATLVVNPAQSKPPLASEESSPPPATWLLVGAVGALSAILAVAIASRVRWDHGRGGSVQ